MSNIKNEQTAKVGLSGLFGQRPQEVKEDDGKLKRVDYGKLTREELLGTLSDEVREELQAQLKRRQLLKSGRPVKGESKMAQTVPMTFRIRPEKQAKIREVALREGMFMGEIMELAIDRLVEHYEKEGRL